MHTVTFLKSEFTFLRNAGKVSLSNKNVQFPHKKERSERSDFEVTKEQN